MEIREDTQDGNVQHTSPYISEENDELSESDDKSSDDDELEESEIIGDGMVYYLNIIFIVILIIDSLHYF